jgi:hypothetical protein
MWWQCRDVPSGFYCLWKVELSLSLSTGHGESADLRKESEMWKVVWQSGERASPVLLKGSDYEFKVRAPTVFCFSSTVLSSTRAGLWVMSWVLDLISVEDLPGTGRQERAHEGEPAGERMISTMHHAIWTGSVTKWGLEMHETAQKMWLNPWIVLKN